VATDRALARVLAAIEGGCRELKRSPSSVFGGLIRQAIDEVVDGPRTGRYSLDQVSKTEKTYVGTKVEIIVRAAFGFEPGKRADVEIAGTDVDIKWSQTLAWMIGPENVDGICLGLGLHRGGKRFSVGAFRATRDLCRKGQNRDAKLSLSAESLKSRVTWIVRDSELPPNFIAEMPARIRAQIFKLKSAQDRVKALATLMPRVPIPRRAFETVAQGRFDPMRRLRRDKYRTDPLGGMVLLSTKYGRSELIRLGFKDLPKDHWVAVPIEDVRD
jgi:hypothetical protein